MTKEQIKGILPQEVCKTPEKILVIHRARIKQVQEIGDGCKTLQVPLRPGDWRNLNNVRLELISACYQEQTATFFAKESGNEHPVALSFDQTREKDDITYIDRAKLTVERVRLDGQVWLRVALPAEYELRGEPKLKQINNGQEGAF